MNSPYHLRILLLAAVLLTASACGNGGSINFDPGYLTKTYAVPKFTMTEGGLALVVEDGLTPTTGYHGKLQFNSVSGIKMSNASHYAKIKYTVRNR
ncbi:MAG: hypothetical protein KF799_15095 [Bdellovibrionales bacterium]|nr:hypothetical protein [Bdellovibrionales bacterium]